jgi:para-nitrobenzyl esterase
MKSVLVSLAILTGCSLHAQQTSVNNASTPAPEIRIASGLVCGVTEGDVTSFKGIPYAAPPVGEFRWRPPQPVKPWQGVRDANDFGPNSAQTGWGSSGELQEGSSEDCLYLNLWRPANAEPGSKLPVMVWIHGGAFLFGSGSQPSTFGVRFAEQGVILITINYRLGRLGFFAFPALSKEHPDELKGNYAYMDQLEALKWVQKNIAAFGGDPKNVTIFGESAGGASVHALVTSPLSQGMFQKAIIESGGGRDGALTGCPLSKDTSHELSAETIGVNFATKHGIEGTDDEALARLRSLSAAEILSEGMTAPLNSETYSGPIVDGRIVLETSQNIYKEGRQMNIPLIVGANSADAGDFVRGATKDEVFSLYGPKKEEARATYDQDGTMDLRALIMIAGRDRVHLEPVRMTARAFTAKGSPVYVFRFSYVRSSMRERSPEGASHGSEIPFVFNTLETGGGYGPAPGPLTAEDHAVANAIQAYWVNFARTGNPNGRGLTKWPQYNADKDEILDFRPDGSQVAGPDPWKARLDLAEYLNNTTSIR